MLTARIYGICLVKNEDDIIAESLTYALKHCTRIFVIDNGSTDATWNTVQYLSDRYPQIVPLLQTYEPFSNGLRALAYNKYHSELSNQDWWLIVDADEMLAEDPQPIIQSAIREQADVIQTWQIQFCYTDVDHKNSLEGRDRSDLSIDLRRRYYKIDWQEARLFRNDPERPWDTKVSKAVPDGLRKVCRRRIFNRHYQYRDIEQIQQRLALRLGDPSFRHVTKLDWQSVVVCSRRLNYHQDGEPWHFSISGLVYYYRYVLKSWYRAVIRRLRPIISLRTS